MTPVGKSRQKKAATKNMNHTNFNKTQQNVKYLMSPQEQASVDTSNSQSKNKTQQLNKMLKNLISEAGPSYSQLS